MGTIRKEVTIGVLVSLFVTAAGVFLYLQYFSRYGFEETIELVKQGNLYGKILSLAALPNILVFFVYIRKKQDYRARGVLLATILIAILTVILKYF